MNNTQTTEPRERDFYRCAILLAAMIEDSDTPDRLGRVKHRFPGLLLGDVGKAEAFDVTAIREPVAEDLPSADIIIRPANPRPRFPHLYDGCSDR